jgi:asparagine synthase (glutamine-hydrolysing)
MSNTDGNLVIVYNGEIFNFRELRAELRELGHRFASDTDSEVAVHAYEAWGRQCLDRFDGMFAFAIWDRSRRQLFLARDRYGVKPIYWTRRGTRFAFGSEIKALLQLPDVTVDVSYPALNEYFTFQNVLSDLTLFEGIRLLPAGCWMLVDLQSQTVGPPTVYWDYSFSGYAAHIDPEASAEELRRLFVNAVSRQLVSDVPVGTYLSGGIDSGSITAVAVQRLDRLRTFTGGFDLSSASGLELGFDERQAAEEMANLFKTEHYEVVMHAGDMEYVLPELIWHLEDLRVGQSYPNYYVARLASKFVKVVLSGAGGDELFAGYPWRYYPGSASDRDFISGYYRYWQRLVPDEHKKRLFRPATRHHIGDHNSFDAFRTVLSGYDGPLDNADGRVNASLYFELKTFLHGLLVVEDKVSMAHGLETRVPFLDRELVEFALGLAPSLKLRNVGHSPSMDENTPGKRLIYEQRSHDGKVVLRSAMAMVVPAGTLRRSKQGFSAPDASWFRGESIDYINRLLRDSTARIHAFVEPDYTRLVLDEHTSGLVNHRLLIWSLLSFEWWCRIFLDRTWSPSELRRPVG